MSRIVDVLYPVPDLRRTAWSSLKWWESRRLAYNQAVGAAGLVTLAGVSLLMLLPPHSVVVSPAILVGAAVYGVAANGCYSLGWVTEMVVRKLWGRNAPDIGPLLFRQGMIFSVGLTLLPLLVAAFFWVVRIVLAVAGA